MGSDAKGSQYLLKGQGISRGLQPRKTKNHGLRKLERWLVIAGRGHVCFPSGRNLALRSGGAIYDGLTCGLGISAPARRVCSDAILGSKEEEENLFQKRLPD